MRRVQHLGRSCWCCAPGEVAQVWLRGYHFVLAGCGATHWQHLPQNFSAVISSLGVLLIWWEKKKEKKGEKQKQNKKGDSIKLVNLPQTGK